ncbi:hypothetical protein [Parvularcula sp. IMCC14364]|uniref:CBU_0592 family membrane protein n=1 Tax=Parvularcula sp. IMCC14364 TaxID=3067902 RepID=UPI0027414744|nr:hypothetical protein [Parvularcula sp. IMCC14364]
MSELSLGWPDLVGFVGVAFLLSSYAGLQFGKISAEAPLYSVLNALAALLILFSLIFSFNAASFVIELFWLIISLVGLVRSLRKRAKESE